MTPPPITPLEELIHTHIRDNGPMPFEMFMEWCLRHPEHGYYMTRDPLGAEGDFATAPEISQMFGEMVALWCVDVWMKMGSPKDFILLECGPGRGTLMDDVLRSAKAAPDFLSAAQPWLIEKSLLLRAKQNEKLGGRIQWAEELKALPHRPIIMFCNELFDTFAIARFAKTPAGWAEQAVTLENEALSLTTLPPAPAQQRYFSDKAFRLADEGAIAELSRDCAKWMEEFSSLLAQQGGAALIIDYGYEGPMTVDSVQAIHVKAIGAGLLQSPGQTDISGFVDFSMFRGIAEAKGLATQTVRAQRDFLLHCGILQRARMLKLRATPQQQEKIDADLTRLLSAERMGMYFKAFCITQKGLSAPVGF